MIKKANSILVLLIFIMDPLLLMAQNFETTISADQVLVKSDNIIHAIGNVEVRRGEVFVLAGEMIVYEKEKQIKITDIKEFFDGNTVEIAAQNAVLSSDLSEGIITAANVLIDETLRFRAQKIELKNSTIKKAQEIDRITSCEDCENGFPLWHFTASSARNDVENKNIVYRNVTLRVRGLPIGYIPYLRLPSPGVDRARGFLIPELNISSNLGLGIKLPYFIPIGESRDLLLTPYISPKTKGIEYRYRQVFLNGELTFNGAFANDDINNKALRSYYYASGNFELSYGVNLKIKSSQTSDDTFLGDYSYGSVDDLNTEITLDKTLVDRDRLFSGDLKYSRANKEDNSLEEFYSLSSEYTKRIKQKLLPGNLYFEVIGNSALNIAERGQVTRPPSSIASEIRYSNDRYAGPVKISNKSFTQVISFVNSENIASLEEDIIAQYGVSSTFSIPLYKQKDTSIRQFSPKIILSYNGQEGRAKGDYFVSSTQLSMGNLYTDKKLTSASESELGFSISGGLEYSSNWDDGRALEFWFGGMWLQDTTTVQNQIGNLQPETLNYVVGFDYQQNKTFFVNGYSLTDDKGEILTADLKSEVRIKDFNLNGRYEFIDSQMDSRINQNLENINLSTSYESFENFSVSANRRYDLSKSEMASSTSSLNMNFLSGFWKYQFSQTFDSSKPEKTAMSATYDDDCTILRISFENISQTEGLSDSIQSLAVSVQLKSFSSFTLPSL